MKKIYCSKIITDMDGKPLKNGESEVTVGRVIAKILSETKTKFDALKAWDMAQRFYKGAEIEIDDSDFETLKTEIGSNTMFIPLVLGQILKSFIEGEKQ